MSRRLTDCFVELKRTKRKGLIPFITAGDPSLDMSRELALGLVSRGADIIELGFPFSDPVADGPTIQKASWRALKRGVTLGDLFALVGSIRKETEVPLVLLTYYNPVFRTGLREFVLRSLRAGLDGLVIPDLSFEESAPLRRDAGESLALISFVSPRTSGERIRIISEKSRGFLYCISAAGVTGVRSALAPETQSMIHTIRENTDLPLALGFGISTARQVEEAASRADAVIVGSALVEKAGAIESEEDLKNYYDFFSHLRKGCRRPPPL